jgi:hypothetical protein
MSTDNMPNPSAYRFRYRADTGMIGNYPWSYVDQSAPKVYKPGCEYELLWGEEDLDGYIASKVAEGVAQERERCIAEIVAVGPKDGPFALITRGFVDAIRAGHATS